MDTEKITVSENVKKTTKIQMYNGPRITWNMFNRKVENGWKNGSTFEYIGTDMHKDGQLFCVFKEKRKGMKDKFYYVDNDVVFAFQKNNKPIQSKNQITEKEINS